jgi:Primase C terminal 2 (PriCT-2)/Bifunctional DNA primase/polymerase, N-terminal
VELAREVRVVPPGLGVGVSLPLDPTELRLALHAANFSPIPVEGKIPGFTGWQEKVGASVKEIRSWGKNVSFAKRTNTGILCKWTPFADVDIRVEAAAATVEQLIRDRFGEHGRILVRTGSAPKRGVLFRAREPFSKITVKLIAPDGSDKDRLEFLASGQQFVAFGIHPDTGKPYTWDGGEPGEVKVTDLPPITEAEARELMEDAADLLCTEHGYKRASKKKPGKVDGDEPSQYEQHGDPEPSTREWTPAEEAKLRSALDAIPTDEEILNEELGDSHMAFVSIGRALERLGWGERGKAIWRGWCAKSPKFEEKGLNTQWRSFQRTRDSSKKKVTVGTIYFYAKAFGWRDPDEERTEAEPTYTDDATTGAAKARAELEQVIEAFLDAEPNWWERYGGISRFVHAAQATTGIGKTQIAARVIARRIKSGRLTGPVGYAVPTHRLGEDIAELFRAEGITAEVWRGRKAFISGKSGPTMCDDLAAVKIAEDMGAVIETACCKGKDPAGRKVTCQFYDSCAYQAQKARKPDVWIFAHQMLFRQNKTLDGLSVLFIDESFRDAGTSKPVKGLTLDEIETVPPCPAGALGFYREQLAFALRAMPGTGGVPRKILREAVFEADWCTIAIKLEWSTKAKTTLWPGMPAKERAAAAKAGTNIRHTRTFDRVWRAARELLDFVFLEDEDVVSGDIVSGRLFLANHKTENGTVRIVRTRGIRDIAKQYVVPTFIMDATLPAKSILEKWFPDVEVISEIEVPMSHVTVKQVLGAPVAAKKLAGRRNLRAVRRHILQQWLETGRGTAVVIMQKDPEAALRATGLPPEIATEHFNAIEGLDVHKHVRLLMAIGRTQPGPEAVEADAGALSGVEPVKASARQGRPPWFDKVTRGIRTRDGTGVAVVCDQHPDPLAEDVRQQICEAELVQTIGRGRGVNRTAENPLTINIVADVVLPVTVDAVQEWAAPGLEIEMVVEGIWLESPADMARAWPDDWATEQVAKNWLQANTVTFPLLDIYSKGKCYRARYQHPGAGQKWRTAWVDPAVVPDARGWLEARLGPLAGFEITVIRFALKAESFSVGALDWGVPPVLSVRPGPVQEKPLHWSVPGAPPLIWLEVPELENSCRRHFGTGSKMLPWSTPVVEEVTDPALVRQIHAECAGQEDLAAIRA